jgi:hypothetical protein
MLHPLEHKLDALRTHLRRLLTLHGVSLLVAVGLGAALVLGLTDYLVRFEDRGLRVLETLAAVAALAWVGYRFVYVPLATHFRDVELARRSSFSANRRAIRRLVRRRCGGRSSPRPPRGASGSTSSRPSSGSPPGGPRGAQRSWPSCRSSS